jgi:hypothetical protein
MGFGVSFLDDQDGPGPNKGDRYQEAVEVLTMRVPRVVGGGAFAPAPLLQGMGGSGSPFAQSAIQQAMAQMAGLPQPMGGAQPAGPQAPQAMGRPMGGPRPQQPRPMAPTPRFVPGIDTMGAPAPQGTPTREWEQPAQPTQGTMIMNPNAAPLQTVEELNRRGYQPPPQPWGSGPRSFY